MIPKQVKISGITYQVETNALINDNGTYLGQVDMQQQTIIIKEGMADERTKQTFTHELMHAIFIESGYFDSDYEDMVERLSITLHQTLVDNPELLKYMDDPIDQNE